MSPEKMIGLSFAAAAAKLYEVFDKLIRPRQLKLPGTFFCIVLHRYACTCTRLPPLRSFVTMICRSMRSLSSAT